jgi:hypothetical protein
MLAALAVCSYQPVWARAIPTPDFATLPSFATRMVFRPTGAVLSTSRAWVEPVERGGEALVAVVSRSFEQAGSTVETRTLLRAGRTVKALEQAIRIRGSDDQVLAVSMRQFRHEVLPFESEAIPDDTYPPSATLLYLLGYLPLDGSGRGSFHILGESQVWKVDAQAHGTEEISVPAGRFECRRLVLRLDPTGMDFPAFLRPFLRYFIPEFEAWIQIAWPHLAVRITGPLGPPRQRDVAIELVRVEGTPR